MTALLTSCVIDASVGMKLVVDESLSDEVAQFITGVIRDGGTLFVPDLFYVECTNVLWKHVRRFGYPAELAHTHLGILMRLSVKTMPTFPLLDQALTLAMTYGLSAYDACYVALADHLALPLITADVKLVTAIADPARTRWIGEVTGTQ
jgi:predicted nucleic acid-binding protein